MKYFLICFAQILNFSLFYKLPTLQLASCEYISRYFHLTFAIKFPSSVDNHRFFTSHSTEFVIVAVESS